MCVMATLSAFLKGYARPIKLNAKARRLGKNRDPAFIAAAMVLCVAHTQRERACERDAQVWVC